MPSSPLPSPAPFRILSALLLAVLTSACPTRDQFGPAADAAATPDGDGPSDASEQPDGDGGRLDEGGSPGISITAPASMSYVSGTVQINVAVTGGNTNAVQLLRNDSLWQTLSGPPFVYSWNTAGTPDGDYLLTAMATVDGQVVTSAPVSVSVDHTPPTITSLKPVSGSTAVALRDPITATFSEPVLPVTVSSTSVQLTAGGVPITSSTTLAADGQALTVTVTDPKALTLPATFTATVATTITDRAGNPLVAVAPPWTWTVPAWIELPPLPSEMPPRLAVDATGTPIVTYVTLDTANSNNVFNLRVARFEAGAWDTATFGAPTTDVDSARYGYTLTLDSKGQPVAAWTASEPPFTGRLKVYVGAWTGSAWNTQFPPLDAIPGIGNDPSFPSVRVDSDDLPIVAWREITGTLPTYDAYVARWTGTAWMQLAGTGVMGGAGFSQLMDGPQLVLDENGNPTFGWIEGGGVGAGLSFWNGTTWTRSQTVPGTFTPYPVVDSTGAPLIATRNADLHVLRWDSTLPNWTEPFMPALTPSTSWLAPRLALSTDGSPVVAWTDTSTGVRLGVARWNATAWDTRFGAFNAGQSPLNTTVPELTVDARGSIWVAWREGTATQVWMSNY